MDGRLTMIEINDLYKKFNGLEVLKGVSLTIPTGSIYGLAGGSGAGKSTLLRCINGLESFDSGTLMVDGTDVSKLSESEGRIFRKNIGMIFQQFSLLSRMTVYENIALPMLCWGYKKKNIDKTVKELLELVEIPDKINSRPAELSGGQKQRVAIARALTLNPKILLCDEATSALDPRVGKSILSLLNDINKKLGITIIIVTHQMSVIRRYCSDVAVLEQGKIADFGAPEQVFLRQTEALKSLLGEEDYTLPQNGQNLKLLLSGPFAKGTIITKMARDLGIDFIVLEGSIETYQMKDIGNVVINVKTEDMEKVDAYLKNLGIQIFKV